MSKFAKSIGLNTVPYETFLENSKQDPPADVTLNPKPLIPKPSNSKPPRPDFLDVCLLEELYSWDIPSAQYILHPWLAEGESAMISAKAGVGKTMLSLAIASTIAAGSSMFQGKWYSPTPHKVLYIDGEMRLKTMQDRCTMLRCCKEIQLFNNDLDLHDRLPLNLFLPDCRKAVIEHIQRYKTQCVFVDNISSLYRTDLTNQMESWEVMQMFILQLRKMGVAVVLIDHEGKGLGGSPRGTSAKLDILDTYISLRRTEQESNDGAHFQVHFEKARSFFGKDAEAFEARLESSGPHSDWVASPIEQSPVVKTLSPWKERASELFGCGETPTQVFHILQEEGFKTAKSTCYRWYDQWKEEFEVTITE